MRVTGLTLGVIAGLFSIVLWIVLVFYNRYTASSSGDMAGNTFVMLFLPACLAIISSFMNKKYLMLIAFIWSLPISLYLMFTPGIFAWFVASCITYFICFLLMHFPKNKRENDCEELHLK
ncbi:hypothetical protein [Cytobacillus sp. NCCP-133]|uniref:hypothetical protein n=1 Tax=Cytobacillus sp. NCCP-133 TaxID=766848 RepID=UPI0022317DF8|nr:hypothetical protein [Cytobacillus sp. NCCP-133]GLB61847.1 hypothetical protein NCCP133_39760 [Cytobacillus sp. NCCP-133]